jgi:large subunit ribosomal protein L4
MVKKVEAKSKSKLEAPVYNLAGDITSHIALPEAIFAVEPNIPLMSQYVRVYLANQRQGNASTKTRAEVIGTTKKMYRQKGTGRARHSTAKVNLFRGGGVTFGPQPRDVSMSMNKKQKIKALFSSLSSKATLESIKSLSVADFGEDPKTSKISKVLKKISGKKVLAVLEKIAPSPVVMSLRNIPNVKIVQVNTLNAYDVINNSDILFFDNSIEALKNHYFKS